MSNKVKELAETRHEMRSKAAEAKRLFIEESITAPKLWPVRFVASLNFRRKSPGAGGLLWGRHGQAARGLRRGIRGSSCVRRGLRRLRPGRSPSQAAHYKRVQEFARRFSEQNGSIVCRELLGLRAGQKAGRPARRAHRRLLCPPPLRGACGLRGGNFGRNAE